MRAAVVQYVMEGSTEVLKQGPRVFRIVVERDVLAKDCCVAVMGFFIGLTSLLAVVLRRRGVASLLTIIVWVVQRIPLSQIPDSWQEYLPSGLISPLGNAADWLPSLEYLHLHAFDPSSAVVGTLVLAILLIGLAAMASQRLEL